ncbi:1264_t:CDS:2 [Scutellospora calospora]|uniref:1264_t:CDS:1 n=1 Tax=Scutellospora calospora TaxID=85575 RepID=A0ACA9LEK5_9GLOM|nr:1264_t:CDS:2 [Scutellospora calospora]
MDDIFAVLYKDKILKIRKEAFDEITKEIEKSKDAKKLLDKKLDEKIKKLNLSEDNIEKLTKILNDKISSIIKKTNNGFLNEIKNLQTEKELENLKKIITEHELLSNEQKENIKNKIDEKMTEIKKDSQPPKKPNPNEDILVKEIEKTL